MRHERQRYCSIIGVNTFLSPKGMAQQEIELARSSDEEKQSQIKRLRDFQARNAGQSAAMLAKLKQTVIEDGNVFVVFISGLLGLCGNSCVVSLIFPIMTRACRLTVLDRTRILRPTLLVGCNSLRWLLQPEMCRQEIVARGGQDG